MRKFIITNTSKFDGYAELIYNEKETLICIDMRNAQMDEMTVNHFKSAAPVTIKRLLSNNSFGQQTQVVEDGYEVTFEMFWKDYPLHRNRYKAEKLWQKLSPANQVTAFYSLHGYKKYLSKNQWQTPMIADRYLRDKEYETDWVNLDKK